MKTIVSIIVPCFNQAQYLDECLQSVLNQTFKDWECIIVNDGSPDNTEEITQEWIKKDNRFKYIFITNSGVSNAEMWVFNRLLENLFCHWMRMIKLQIIILN